MVIDPVLDPGARRVYLLGGGGRAKALALTLKRAARDWRSLPGTRSVTVFEAKRPEVFAAFADAAALRRREVVWSPDGTGILRDGTGVRVLERAGEGGSDDAAKPVAQLLERMRDDVNQAMGCGDRADQGERMSRQAERIARLLTDDPDEAFGVRATDAVIGAPAIQIVLKADDARQETPFHLVRSGGSELGRTAAVAVAPLGARAAGAHLGTSSGEVVVYAPMGVKASESQEHGRGLAERLGAVSFATDRDGLDDHDWAAHPAGVLVVHAHGHDVAGQYLETGDPESYLRLLADCVARRGGVPFDLVVLDCCESTVCGRGYSPLGLLRYARSVVATFGKIPDEATNDTCDGTGFLATLVSGFLGGEMTIGEAMLQARRSDRTNAWLQYQLYGDVDVARDVQDARSGGVNA